MSSTEETKGVEAGAAPPPPAPENGGGAPAAVAAKGAIIEEREAAGALQHVSKAAAAGGAPAAFREARKLGGDMARRCVAAMVPPHWRAHPAIQSIPEAAWPEIFGWLALSHAIGHQGGVEFLSAQLGPDLDGLEKELAELRAWKKSHP